MQIDLFLLLVALAGGFFGAAIGALQSFILCGLTVLLGMIGVIANAGPAFLGFVAFGPVFGPHVAFAGGVAAAAYAHRRGLGGGRDIVTPLITLGRADVLLVGAGFGAAGHLVNSALQSTTWFGTHTDTVALTVIVSALVARLAFGRTGIVGALPVAAPARPAAVGGMGGTAGGDGADAASAPVPASAWQRFAPTDDHNWVRYQEAFGQNSMLGFFGGALSAAMAVAIAQAFPATAGLSQTIGFGLSGLSLLFLVLGMSVPVTHHITLIGGLAGATFLPLVGGSQPAALLIGAIAGMAAACLAELFSRFWHIRGDTHIDPPASSIWIMTTVVLGLGAALA